MTILGALATAAGLAAEEPNFVPAFLLNEGQPDPPAQVIGRPSTVALTPFQPADVSSRLRRTLLQFEALLADEAWDEAIELIETLQTDSGDQLTKLPPAGNEASPVEDPEDHVRYVPLRRRCQQLLASMPPAGVAAYRDRVDRTARQRLDDALTRLDEQAAAQVAVDFYSSGPATDARLAASELALERGDTAAARRYLQPIHPLTRDPYGRPAGALLAQLRADADPAELAAAWRDVARPNDDAAVSGEEGLLAIALARLALTSLREGDTRRAAAELLLLRGIAPDAEGRIAGRRQPLVGALATLVGESRSADSGDAPRLGDLQWAWSESAPLAAPPKPSPAQQQQMIRVNGLVWQQQLNGMRPQDPYGEPEAELSPVVAGLNAFFVEAGAVKRLTLTDGAVEKLTLPGVAPDEPPAAGPRLGDVAGVPIVRRGVKPAFVRIGPNGVLQQVGSQAALRIDPSLSVTGGLLFARVIEVRSRGRQAGPVVATTETLLGVDPDSPSRAAVRILAPRDPENPAPEWRFAGPPVLRGERLYVPMNTSGGRTKLAVACYSTATGRQLWLTELGSGSPLPQRGGGVTSPVTLAGDSLYLATDLGAIASLATDSGAVRWLALYPRDAEVAGFNRLATTPPSRPCYVVGDQVLAAPSDSARLLAWDAATGRPLWDAQRPEDANVAGVVASRDGSVIVLAGRQVTSYDTLTGQQRLAWPESAHAGLRGVGEAAIVAGEVFWPTRDALYAIDPTRGGFTRPPIDLSPVSTNGANVVATDVGLLICGPDRLRLLADPQNPEPTAPLSRLMGVAPRALAANRAEK